MGEGLRGLYLRATGVRQAGRYPLGLLSCTLDPKREYLAGEGAGGSGILYSQPFGVTQ